MIRLSTDELAYMKEKGITLCSLCRNSNAKNPYNCLAGLNPQTYGKASKCERFISRKVRTPEECRIASMRANEAQLNLFEAGI